MRTRSAFAYWGLLFMACGGRSHETRESFSNGGARQTPDVAIIAGKTSAGASANGGAAGESTSETTAGDGGSSALGVGDGGAGSDQGGAGLAGAGGDPTDCRAKPYGTPTAAGAPGDCRRTICDGAGSSLEIIDPSDVPKAAAACLTPVCTNAGPGSVPSPPGSACTLETGSGVCDGDGSCFECLSGLDCAPGDSCRNHRCLALVGCHDQQQNGQETAIDCGGPDCGACDDGRTCVINQDCKSDLCDSVFHTCLPDSCQNGKQDNDETDVDCGGKTCAGCYTLKKCQVDADCATQKCNTNLGTCGGSGCTDNRQDGLETDVDCGGVECGPCSSGQKCRFNFDCSTGFCSSGAKPSRCF